MNIKAVYVSLGLSIVAILLSTVAMVHGYLGVNELFIHLGSAARSSGFVYELVSIAILDVAVFVMSVFAVKDSFLDVSMAIYVHEEVLARMRRIIALTTAALSSASIMMILIAIASVI
ncbi:MAG: hypothetical protein RXQ74_06450 [Caldivirga sp.]|jgi:hypothetical protein